MSAEKVRNVTTIRYDAASNWNRKPASGLLANCRRMVVTM
jgi:hypothetical protein